MDPTSSSTPATDTPRSEADRRGDLHHSPLEEIHRDLGAKLVEFGGWLMPLHYPSGTLAEHRACRGSAVVFDVSHLGTVRVHGPDAVDLLQHQLTNDLRKIDPGRAQYTHLLDETDGSVLDDIIVWWRQQTSFDVMPNASNTARVRQAVGGVDVTAERAVLAVQGPQSRNLVARVSPEAAAVGRFRVADVMLCGAPATVAGTGYTGEDGVECAVPVDMAQTVWRAFTDVGVVPAGLGARDTLRLEAGLPLHGHELGPGITPLQAGLGWVVGWDKGEFRGRLALEAERARGIRRKLRGVVAEGRQPPRPGAEVHHHGAPVGTVTSGNFSPSLERGIAMAFVDTAAQLPDGEQVALSQRGRQLVGKLTALPFVGGQKARS
ncbi:MAG TPA: glycine cleavage system aminomethyltransferase GcvT [Acidimicrobiales bacterium]|nr:glycine cleavage system aminomethyltransferase GcvT [Acidimicrobiales bacterium]